jgi:hypothetical protein
MNEIEAMIEMALTGFFSHAKDIHILLSVFSFAIAVCLMPFSFGTGDTGTSRRRFCGALFLLSLAFEASNPGVYAVAVFIVATLITELGFLSGLAAIFWNRPWAFQRPASTDEIEAKEKQETEAESGLPALGGDTTAEETSEDLPKEIAEKVSEVSPERERHKFRDSTGKTGVVSASAFEHEVIRALTRSHLFDSFDTEVALASVTSPQKALAVVDAIGRVGLRQFVVEIKRQPSDLDAVVSQLKFAMDALQNTPEVRRRLIQIPVKGILITGQERAPEFLGDNIISLHFDPSTRKFSNLEPVKKWVRGS